MEKTLMKFYKNLSEVLAHSVMFYAKEQCPFNIRCEQPDVPKLGQEYASIMGTLSQYLPHLGELARAEIGPTEAARLAASQQFSPQYAQLASDLYSQYAPQFQQAATNLIATQGPALAAAYNQANRALNPEAAAATELSAKKMSELLGSIDLNKPSVEAERLVSQEAARTGNLMTPSATSTVANALSFGNELRQRQEMLANALNVANQFTATQGSQFNPVQQMTSATQSQAMSQFPGIVQPGSEGYNMLGNLLGGATQTQSGLTQLGQARKTPLDTATQVLQGL